MLISSRAILTRWTITIHHLGLAEVGVGHTKKPMNNNHPVCMAYKHANPGREILGIFSHQEVWPIFRRITETGPTKIFVQFEHLKPGPSTAITVDSMHFFSLVFSSSTWFRSYWGPLSPLEACHICTKKKLYNKTRLTPLDIQWRANWPINQYLSFKWLI